MIECHIMMWTMYSDGEINRLTNARPHGATKQPKLRSPIRDCISRKVTLRLLTMESANDVAFCQQATVVPSY